MNKSLRVEKKILIEADTMEVWKHSCIQESGGRENL